MRVFTPCFRRFFGGMLLWLGGLLAPALALAQAASPIHLEAENATLKGPSVVTTIAGYSGTGYVADFSNSTDSLVYSVSIPSAGRYDLSIRYNTPSGNRATTQYVDGSSSSVSLPNTGQAFGTAAGGRFTLAAGIHRLVYAANQGYYGIDYIELAPVSTVLTPLTNGRAEAEQGVLSGVTVATSPTGFSGTGFVTGFDNSDAKNVSITIDNPTAGLYQLSVGYTSPYGLKVANVTVNDSKSTVTFAGTSSPAFAAADAGKVLLPQGLNTITIGGNYGYYGIDYIQLTPATVALPAKPAKQLTDPLATPRTRALFSYLVDLYGTKVLAGQQDDQYGRSNSEVSYVLATTGKEPAIVSMDLLNYASSAVAAYGPSNDAERYLTWATSGNGRGITSLIWHWRAPTDLVHPGDPSGAFYTVNTTFNFAAALADTTSSRYHLLLNDIDLIAAQLQKFQAAGVPVLWRPLHETPGTFFWWGAQGPTAFKQLWQLLYTRLTVRHQLHNLIWVYSINDVPDPAWYPGDAYVDVASADIYQATATPNPNVNVSSNWAAMQNLVAPRKLVALSESESLVNPDQVRGYATWWSWFCAWQGSYIRNQPVSFLTSLYNDRDIITKDKLADWAAAPLASRSGAATTAAGLTVYPNPTQDGPLTISLIVPTAQEASLELVNTLGQPVLVRHTRLQAGPNQVQVPLNGLASGLYQLVISPAGQPPLSQQVLISN